MWYSTGWWGLHALKDYLVGFFLSGSEYHLWYILASIYGIILFYIFLSFVSIDAMKYLCAAGWIIESLLYSYSWIGIDNIEMLNWLTSHFSVCFDAAFRAIPLMAVGLFCAQKPSKQQSSRKWLIFSVVSFVGWVAEASCLYFLSPNEGKYSYILFTPIFTYFMLNWLLTVNFRFKNQRISKWMRDTSLIIYILHPMVIYLLDLTGMSKGVLHWLIVTLLSIISASIFVFLKNRVQLRIDHQLKQ